MKIAVDSLSDKKNHLEEDIPVKDWDMDNDDVTFLGLVHIDCDYFKVNDEIVVEAKVTTQRQANCFRCLASVFQSLSQDFSRSYSGEKTGEYLDLDPDMREEILLNFPTKVLCKEDCLGICADCGANLNETSCNCQVSLKSKTRTNNIDC